ncbi:MAG: type II secretion system protein N [Pseudomonadota bacterium]
MSTGSREVAGGAKRLRLMVEAAGTVLLAIIVARLIWLLVAPGSSIAIAPSANGPIVGNAVRVQAEPADRTVLVRSNPFVRNAASPTIVDEPASDGPDAPETELNLRLTGIRALSGGDGTGSVWIIKPDGQEVMVSIDETIIDGVTLEQIYTDRVTIRSRGRLESLSRRNDEDSFLGLAETSGSATNQQNSRAPAQRAVSAPVSAMALYNGTGFNRLLENGRVLGYRLSPRGGGSVFSQAGFEAGDILLSLNGRSVARFEDDDFIEFFLDQNRIEALVERDGVEVAIQLTLTEDT